MPSGYTCRYIEYRIPVCLSGVKAGYVHLCRVEGNTVDHIWKVTSGNSEMTFSEELYGPISFNL